MWARVTQALAIAAFAGCITFVCRPSTSPQARVYVYDGPITVVRNLSTGNRFSYILLVQNRTLQANSLRRLDKAVFTGRLSSNGFETVVQKN
jgi:hypothetical protein